MDVVKKCLKKDIFLFSWLQDNLRAWKSTVKERENTKVYEEDPNVKQCFMLSVMKSLDD
jgi:hypothetical protein